MAGVERIVKLGSVAYVDPEGRHRRADCGATVLVHPDTIERFDRLNVLQGQVPEPEPEPEPLVEDKPVEDKPAPRRTGSRARS